MSETDVTGNVPNEIWMKIIGYLKTEDVFLGFGQVCKRFNDLTHDPTAIKSFEFLNGDSILSTGIEKVLKILRRSKSLKRIVLDRYADFFIEDAVFSNPQLKSVTLYGIQNDSFSKIVESLTKAKGIKHLEILNSYYGYKPFDVKLLMNIADIKNLKTLRLNLSKQGIDADFIKKISLSCSNLETIELSNYAWKDPGMQIAFDKLFKERKETLKSFILLQWSYDDENMNILRNLSLCQNLEELSLKNHDYVLQQLPTIVKLSKIKRLMFRCGENPEIFKRLIEFFNEARFPLLERLCIADIGENVKHVKLVSDAPLKSLLQNSPALKSIHFLDFDYDIWNLSNKLLFQIIKESNVYINFGKIKIGYDYKVGLVLSAQENNQKRQLSLEQFLLDHDMTVFNKYQKMKDDFHIWFKERSNWHSFDCINELYKED